MLKDKIYQVTASAGISMMSKLFPEQFAKEPVRPSDRYLEYNFALNHLPKLIPWPPKVLDVGCVSSLFPLVLAGFGYDVTALDMRDYPILKKLKFPHLKFIKHNICEPLSGEFDCVTAISTIEHIGVYGRYGSKKDDEADIKAMDNLYSLLKNEGKLILTMPVGRYKILAPYQKINDWRHIMDLIRGFRIEEEKYYMIDKEGYWFQCDKFQAFDVKQTKDCNNVALYSLIKCESS